MKLPTVNQLQRVIDPDMRRLLRSGGWLPEGDEPFLPHQLLGFAVAEQLSRYGHATLAISLVLQKAKAAIVSSAHDAAKAVDEERTATLTDKRISIADEKYVACSDSEGFLDLLTGGTMEILPRPPVLLNVISLVSLFLQTASFFDD